MDHVGIWIVGAGYMAREYARVLSGMSRSFVVIGRGREKVAEIEKEFSCCAVAGGLDSFLKNKPQCPEFAIVTVNIDKLSQVTKALIKYGVKNILLEKPGALTIKELQSSCEAASEANASVYLAYNRRFYSSTMRAKKIIEEDGGITSLNFEFTEWPHKIEPLPVSSETKAFWFLANSTHVVDLAFHLAGTPKQLSAYNAGKDVLGWHKRSSQFAGAGITEQGALFSYCANWNAPGRWSAEFMTPAHRLIFRPMEQLQIQKLGSVNIESVDCDDQLDRDYKPGVFLQTKAFLDKNISALKTIYEQLDSFNLYYKMAGYEYN